MLRVYWLLLFVLFAALPVPAAQPWIDAVGKDTLLCVSPKADPAERQAAERVLAELRRVQPDAVMLDPEKLAFDYDTLGTHHVIVVGEWADNLLMRMTWGFWATSRAQRDWEAKGEAGAKAMLQLWDRDLPAVPWRSAHDFYAFGYGDFDGPDIGYVQTVRNTFPIMLRAVPGQQVYNPEVIRPLDKPPYNQMYFMVHLTGTGPNGVVKAVDAFLRDGILNGVLPGKEAKLPADWTLERLGTPQLAGDLPAWAPVADLPPNVQYIGQQLPGCHLYAGFTEASGVRPLRCWRLKYRLEYGFLYYDNYPTNRASGNELFIARFATANDAQAALKNLLADKVLKDNVAVRDEYLVMHSFGVPEGDILLKKAVAK